MIVVLSSLDGCREPGPQMREDAAIDSLGGRFLAIARRFAPHPAIVTRSRRYSYGVIATAAVKLAAFLSQRADFVPGCRVAIVAGNTPEYVVAFYGIVLAGGIAVPLPAGIEPDALRRVRSDCDADLLLAAPGTLEHLQTATDDSCDLLDLTAQRPPCTNHAGEPPARSCTDALILYTSGSTGKPKGVLLSQRNVLANADSIVEFLPHRQRDRALALLPFCHAYGNSILQTHLLTGATLILDGSTTFPNSIVDAMERHQVTSFAGVPEVYSMLLTCSDLGDRRLPHLRYATAAGAAIAPDAAIEIAHRISPAPFYVMYGQTEATARLAYLPPDELPRRPGSIGKAIPGVELQVRSPDGLSQDFVGTGELCARGPNVMRGYWGNAADTAQVMKDGWLHTGDLATVDEDGFFYVKGRCRDQVKIRGLKVVPSEIADTLSRQLSHRPVAVVPFTLHNATRLALFVASDPGQPVAPAEIRQVCVDALSRHQIPSHVEVLDRLPLTASLKVDLESLARRAVRQAASRSIVIARDAAHPTVPVEERV